MEFSAPAIIDTPAGVLTANNPDVDWLMFTGLEGFDDPEDRPTVEPKSRTDGAFVYDDFDGAIFGTVSGYIRTSNVADRNNYEDIIVACLRSIRRADGTFTITPTAMPSRKLTVRKHGPILFTPEDGIIHKVQFSLVSGGFWVNV